MDILVTGANGYCGQHIVLSLLEQGHAVWGISRSSIESEAIADHPNFYLIQNDLLSLANLPTKIDSIVHTAASLGVPGVSTADMVRNNVEVLRPLIDYAIKSKTKKFIFFSALSVFGTITVRKVDEETPVVNPNPYGMTKLIGEQMLAKVERDFASVSLRLPGIIGPNSTHSWLDRVRLNLSANEDVSFINPDTLFNNAVLVSELSEFVASLVSSPLKGATTALLGAGEEIAVGKIIDFMAKKIYSKSKITSKINPDASGFIIDCSKAKKELGWQPSDMLDLLDTYLSENKI